MPNRWWTYQRERFPLATHVPFAILLAVASLGWSTAKAGRPAATVPVLAAAAATTLLFLLQLRVADEFKDLEDDRRFRPERPVPRGLVTLRQLAILAAGAGLVQLFLALYIHPRLVVTLAALWTYWGLMSAEFFAPRWLKAHPVAYLVSHMIVVPLLLLHVTGFDWLQAGAMLDPALGVFLAFSLLVGIVVELGRKTWSPEQERPGVETYSALWGVRGSATAFGAAILAASVAASLAFSLTNAHVAGPVTASVIGLAGLVTAIRFARTPTKSEAKTLNLVSALAAFLLYILVGILPRYGGLL